MKHAALNKVYRLVWNTACQCWQAVSECARSRTKGTSTALISTLLFSSAAFAGPTGGEITAGQGIINQSGTNTTITQQTPRLAIDWNTFSIGQHEFVNFNQPSASSIALNRVTGAESSSILGSLTANGQVWILNPNGVLFGNSAQVSVGGLVASTLNLSNEDFMAGKYSFTGNGTGTVGNQGTIKVPVGGTVAFMAPVVRNSGSILASQGHVLLAAAEAVTIKPVDSSLAYTIDRGAVDALVENGGLIKADGGRVVLTAAARDSLAKSVTNNTGIIEANTVQNHNGTILLLGDMQNGTVNVAGTLSAAAPKGGDGGFIETSAAKVKVADGASISTNAPFGKTGQWLIDPIDFTIAATGGDITGTQLGSNLGGSNVTIQSTLGSAGTNGDVNVNDTVSWSANKLTLNAQRNININIAMNGSGTAQLALEYGQSAVAAGNSSDYYVNAPVNLPAGNNFSTKLGNDGGTNNYTVIKSLGDPGSMTSTDLQGMNGNLSGRYVLGSNIDAGATAGGIWDVAGFMPVGNSNDAQFTGVFDGLGHSVINLTINRPSTFYVGLFGEVGNFGIVKNVGIMNGNVKGGFFVGGLAGANVGSISNSYANGVVSGNELVGGLVGGNRRGVLSNTIISNSYATGVVSGNNYVGGLVGYNEQTINNSYAIAGVSGSDIVGGLVGANALGSVRNSYSSGAVAGSSNFGGLVGNNSGTIGNSFWNTTTSGQAASAGGIGLTTAQMQIASNFTGFNFTTTPGATGNNWVMVDIDGTLNNAGGATGGTFPMLASEYSTTINNAHQLQLMAMNLSANYSLGQNINAAATGTTGDIWSGSTFIPVGTHTNNFLGSFDGLGQSVSNLVINLPTNEYVGLFGESGGTIKNVGLIGGYVKGNNFVGGLLGRNNYGNISNSYTLKAVTGVGYYIGGLAGANFYGTISNSHATGAVSGNNSVGGLVGNGNGTIVDSYASGDVNSGYFVGGLIGVNNGSVSNSYATGKVTGSAEDVGGLIGANQGSINNSHSEGLVTGAVNVGGLVGLNNFGAISDTYSTSTVMSSGDNVGGLVGLNKDTITKSHSVGAVTGNNNSGGLAGNNSGNISNSYSDSKVSGVGNSSGGLVGLNDGIISNTHASGAITGLNSVGGLVGYNTGSISTSYSTGALTGSYYVGGLVGFNIGDVSKAYTSGAGAVSGNYYVGGLVGFAGGTISNSYATKIVAGNYYVGGLVGKNIYGAISNTYATGLVTGNGLIGGLAGENFGSFTNSFWDVNTTGQATSAGGAGLTTAQMQQQTNFAGFDFNNIWIIYNGHTDPLLRSFMTPLTVTANSAGKTYDGLAYNGSNGVTYSITPNSNLFGTPSFSGTAQGAANAGSYAITASGLYSNQQGYSINYVDGALTIGQRSVNLTGSRIYDGTTSVASSIFTFGNLVSGETLTLSGTGSVASKNVAAGTQSVTLGTLALVSGIGLASNYTFTGGTQTADITPLAVTASLTAANKIYDGNTNATITGNSLTGVIGTDAVGSTITSASFDTKNVGTAKTVTASGIGLTGFDAGNYSVATTATTQADITPKALTLASVTASNKIYDGNTSANISAKNISGIVPNDVVGATVSSANFDTKNVGTGKTVTVNGIALSGTDAGNYTLNTTTATTLANITPKALSITGFASANKVYDRTTLATITNKGTLSGVVSGDTVSFTNGSATFSDRNAGLNKSVTLNGVVLGGLDAANYSYSGGGNDLSDITPKPVSINGFSVYDKKYDGTILAVIRRAGTLSGVISGDFASFYYSNATFANALIGKNKTVTLNGVGLIGVDALNYIYIGPTTTKASITP